MDWGDLVSRYRLRQRVTGVVHCGAHLAEEAPHYAELGVPVWWVEGNARLYPAILNILRRYPRQRLVPALLSDEDGKVLTLHVSGPGYMGSSSVLDWGTHRQFSPLRWVDHVTLPSRTLDGLVEEHGVEANMLVMDLQGAEGMVLRGAARLLDDVDWVIAEVNRDEVYRGCTRVWELDEMLAPGLVRMETHWVADQGWGDALWVRRSLYE